jgi:hypothetical protein
MRRLALALVLLAALAPAASAQTLQNCREISSATKRLDCYDALDANAVDPHALLLRLLGDPKKIGKDYDLLGNAGEVFHLLPGRWLMGPWGTGLGFLEDREKFLKACDRIGVDIAYSSRDLFTLSVTRQDPKKGTIHLRDLMLSTYWRLGEATDIGGTFDWLGLDPKQQGLNAARSVLARPVSLATYLPVTRDAVLRIDSQAGEVGLLLRCPAE